MLNYITLQFNYCDSEHLCTRTGADVKAVHQTALRHTSSLHRATAVQVVVRKSDSSSKPSNNRKRVVPLRGCAYSQFDGFFVFPNSGKREFDMEETLKKKAEAYFTGPRRHYGDFTDAELVRCVRECVTKNDLKDRHVAIAIFRALGITPEMLVEQLTWTGEPELCEEDALAI